MKFDGTISLGAVLIAVSFIVTMLGLYGAFVQRFTRLEMKVESMWQWFERKLDGINGSANDHR